MSITTQQPAVSESKSIDIPERSYFTLVPRGRDGSSTPYTPDTPASEDFGLLSPRSELRPKFKISARSQSPAPKENKVRKDAPVRSLLQSRWGGTKVKPPLTRSISLSDISSPIHSLDDLSHKPGNGRPSSGLAEPPYRPTSANDSFDSILSDDLTRYPDSLASSHSGVDSEVEKIVIKPTVHLSARKAAPVYLSGNADSVESVARTLADEEGLRVPVVFAKDYAIHNPDSLVNGRWAQRLRSRPSQDGSASSRSASPSPSYRSTLRDPLDKVPLSGASSKATLVDPPTDRAQANNDIPATTIPIFDIIHRPYLRESRRPSDLVHIDHRDDIDEQPEPVETAAPRTYHSDSDSEEDISDDELLDDAVLDLEEEIELEMGPAPEIPPVMEYIDPEIVCTAPDASTATLPLAETILLEQTLYQHPWAIAPFNISQRAAPVIRKFRATFKVVTSLVVVGSLLVGYGLKLKIVTVGPWSFGMYGLLLILDFIVQTIAASFNRIKVNRVTKASPIVAKVNERIALKDIVPAHQLPEVPEVSIAVVGYREDEEAWIACLKSLQAQEYPIKHIIGVVDGNDGPDVAMAVAFGKAFPEDQRLIVHLPVLLSVMYKEKYWGHLEEKGFIAPTRWEYTKMFFTQAHRDGQEEAHDVAWNYVLTYLHAKATEGKWADWKGICFTQPHGHKRHAMFTSFMVGAYALGTKDALLTTDSDTYVYPDTVKNMMGLLFSDERLAGVTGDVRIWNKKESFLALMSSLRYWFAFNVERACQSAFGCVGCLSGPLGLYKTSDLMSVLGPWILQSFLGKETTFGDDRHLTNRILSKGLTTGYSHLGRCDSDTPAGYVRWVKQQTRWSKSFFREAFWFPKSFAYHKFWLTVETTKQFLYPFVLTATILHMLFLPTTWIRPVIWIGTMFGVAVVKSTYGVIVNRDPAQFLFGIYGFLYFFGLLPSKLFACFTVYVTNWGTSARSKSEFTRPESFLSRTTHVGHLVVWYLCLDIGFAYLLVHVIGIPLLWTVGIAGLLPIGQVYADVITGETKYFLYVMKKKWKLRQAAKAPVDIEKTAVRRKNRSLLRRIRRSKRASAPVIILPENESQQDTIFDISPNRTPSIIRGESEDTFLSRSTLQEDAPPATVVLPDKEAFYTAFAGPPTSVLLAKRAPGLMLSLGAVRKHSYASSSSGHTLESQEVMTPPAYSEPKGSLYLPLSVVDPIDEKIAMSRRIVPTIVIDDEVGSEYGIDQVQPRMGMAN